jgi:hypothetical protein
LENNKSDNAIAIVTENLMKIGQKLLHLDIPIKGLLIAAHQQDLHPLTVVAARAAGLRTIYAPRTDRARACSSPITTYILHPLTLANIQIHLTRATREDAILNRLPLLAYLLPL